MGFFSKKKKEQPKDIVIDNPAFGPMKLSPTTGWFSVEKKQFVLWEKEFKVWYDALIDTPEDAITAEQEQSFELFQEKLDSFRSQIEAALEERFAPQKIDVETLQNSLEFNSIYFSRDGKIGIPITTDLDNDILEWCDIGPDDQFAVMLYPELKISPSNEEFTEIFFYI